jgi:Zn-dependent oligopeptidase
MKMDTMAKRTNHDKNDTSEQEDWDWDRFGILYHEFGHMLHDKSVPEGRLDSFYEDFKSSPEKQKIAKKISSYAATNMHEFIAETYQELVSGKKLPQDVMDLYRQYNGPALP